jgi:hypothetical protein
MTFLRSPGFVVPALFALVPLTACNDEVPAEDTASESTGESGETSDSGGDEFVDA